MSILPPAKPIIAVDLTAKPKQIREGGLFRGQLTARRCISVQQASEAFEACRAEHGPFSPHPLPRYRYH